MISFAFIVTQMWIAFKAIVASFFKDASIWWLLGPVFLLWFSLELYFGKYKKEKLGWNTSLANGISLVWVGVESMRFLFANKPELFWLRFFVVLMIIFYGLFIMYITFQHKFSANTTYILASPTPIYFLSTVTILWGHGSLILTWWIILDLFLLYWLAVGFFALLHRLLPEAEKEAVEPEEPTEPAYEAPETPPPGQPTIPQEPGGAGGLGGL